ncbi:hypothetical protein DM01DRAFT_1162672 [Hesseltinella vesiculosa]|uniref:TFIIS central domain-containing protein n=1 Tax=Hesseltinella vesiculosa TaxID=101127 RepID=A0A1X2GU79_9FUNG|nr:hypothetical protein DM01DRAFT_1162672 [Hesseltinella vesiculosa]
MAGVFFTSSCPLSFLALSLSFTCSHFNKKKSNKPLSFFFCLKTLFGLELGRATESQKELQNTTSSSTRSSPLHKCLLPSCNNSTRPDSYCSNTCAKQHAQESASSTKKPNTTRSRSASNKKQSTPPPPTVAAVSVMDLVRKNVTKSLTAALVSILTSLQRLPTELQQQVSTGPLEMAQAMASKLEQGLFEHWTTPPTPTTTAHFDAEANYKARVRSLLHNLRDKNNQGFQERVVCGDISIDDLATMTAEDMANPALRSMSASLREQSLKNSILPTAPSLPLVKKTHKGEVVMSQVSDNNHVSNSQSSTPGHLSYRRPQMIAADRNQPNPTNIPPTTAPKHPHDHKENTSAPPSSLSPSAETSHPDVYQKLFGNAPAPLTSTHDTSTQRTNIDLEQMYDDDEEGVQLDIGDDDKLIERRYGEAAYLWHGKVVMPEVANFVAKAKQVGGRSLSKKEWQTLLATGSLFVEGRIPTASANNYLMSLQARSDKYDFALLLVQCDTAAGGASSERQMQSLLTHLIYKERYGVVGRDKAKIKDFYLIPLDRDHHIPRYLQSMVDASTFGPASPSPTSPLTSTDGFLAVLILPKPLASSS